MTVPPAWQKAMPLPSTQVHRQYLAGVRRGNRHLAFARCAVGVDRGEQRLTRHQPFAGTEQLAKKTALLGRTITKHGVQADAGLHVHHAARLTNRRLIGIQLNFNVLHLVAKNFVVNDVHAHVFAPLGWVKFGIMAVAADSISNSLRD
jgi:hypothetical protein